MPASKKKKRRKLPANIITKTDREIAERVLGKRVLKAVDAVLDTQPAETT